MFSAALCIRDFDTGGFLMGSWGCRLIVASGLSFQAREIVRIAIFYQFIGSDLTRSRAW
jgi:hypothetical protein